MTTKKEITESLEGGKIVEQSDDELSPEQATKQVRKLAREGRIEFASSFGVEAYESEIDDFCKKAFGKAPIFVSDESSVGDFLSKDKREGTITRIFELYGLTVDGHTTLLEIMRALHGARA